MKKSILIIIFFCSLFLVSCNSTESPLPPFSYTIIDLSGSWIGTFLISSLNQSGYISFTLSQKENDITGTFNTSTNRFGNMSGRLSGSNVTGKLTFTDSCGGQASISANVEDAGKKIVGNGSTNDCIGSYSFTFNITKQ